MKPVKKRKRAKNRDYAPKGKTVKTIKENNQEALIGFLGCGTLVLASLKALASGAEVIITFVFVHNYIIFSAIDVSHFQYGTCICMSSMSDLSFAWWF